MHNNDRPVFSRNDNGSYGYHASQRQHELGSAPGTNSTVIRIRTYAIGTPDRLKLASVNSTQQDVNVYVTTGPIPKHRF